MPGRAPSRSIPGYWSARECCQVIIKLKSHSNPKGKHK